MTLWLAFLPLILGSLLFLLWRLKFPPVPTAADESDLEANRTLYREKMVQLEQQLESGEIDRDQYHALELEHQRQFLADNTLSAGHEVKRGGQWLVLACAVLVPLAAIALYQYLGASTEMKLRQQLERRSELFMSGEANAGQMKLATGEVIDTLSRLAAKRPDNPTYPVLLARLYADEGEFEKAVPQYLKATVLLPEQGEILAEYAQVLFFAAGNRMSDKIRDLAFRALELAPRNQIALSLAGIATFQQEEYSKAIDYWNRALAQLPAGAPSGEALRSGIAAARERLGESPASSPAAMDDTALRLQVSLGENVRVPADTTVFVYARQWQGSPMPLAIARLQAADLPREVVLTEAMAMTPAMSLATVDQVEVVARVSLSGTPTPAPGDYQASAGPIAVKKQENPISLAIISQIPQ